MSVQAWLEIMQLGLRGVALNRSARCAGAPCLLRCKISSPLGVTSEELFGSDSQVKANFDGALHLRVSNKYKASLV